MSIFNGFLSFFSIRVCTGISKQAIISPKKSNIQAIIRGPLISICVRNGSVIMNPIDISDTFPDIRDDTDLYSSHRPSFSSVPLRNELLVPLEKALSHTDIQIAPSENMRNPSAKI
jgi:hypothetical protein